MVDFFSSPKFDSQLRQRLGEPKPGLAAQLKMVPNPRPGNQVYTEVEDSCLKAGVLILIYPIQNRQHLILTRRTEKLERHQAQISFPGGRQEHGETLEQTAQRETREELGIHPESIEIIGQLTPLYIPPTNYCIYPFVAQAEAKPLFTPSTFEVAEILEIPLVHLLDSQTVCKEIWPLHGQNVEVPFYYFKGHKIWGATAMVLAELLEVIPPLEELL